MTSVPLVADSPKIVVPASIVKRAGSSTNTAPLSSQSRPESNVVSVVMRPETSQTSIETPATCPQSMVACVDTVSPPHAMTTASSVAATGGASPVA